MYAIQLDFFKTEEQCEIDTLRLHCASLEKKASKTEQTLDKVRKSLYGGRNEDRARLLDHEERLAIVERFICHS